MVIDLKNIELDISNALRTVALELKKIDFEKIGLAVEPAGRELGKDREVFCFVSIAFNLLLRKAKNYGMDLKS